MININIIKRAAIKSSAYSKEGITLINGRGAYYYEAYNKLQNMASKKDKFFTLRTMVMSISYYEGMLNRPYDKD
jgi:hypothetical protein